MGARHLPVLALSVIVITGCQPAPKPADTSEASLKKPATAPTTEATSDQAALARKAEEWAKMLDAVQAKRNATTAPAPQASTQPATEAPTSRPVQISVTAPKPIEPAPGTATALAFTPTTAPSIAVHAPANPTPIPTVEVRSGPPKAAPEMKDDLANRVREGLKNAPRDPAANLDYQLVRFLKDEQAPDLTSLASLPTDDREAISAIIDGLSNFRAVLRGDPTGLTSKKVRPLVDMADRLRAQGDLAIPSVALCSSVKGYGLYDTLKSGFVEGRENKALLYCEVNGFASHLNEGQWETKLTQEVVLYRGETEVWKKAKVDQIVDRCRNKRRDFYLMNLVQFPASLPAGAYALKVTVIDQVANRVAESVLPITLLPANVAGVK